MSTVHYLRYGVTACLKFGTPGEWEPGHAWDSDWGNVNCPDCLLGKGPIATFVLMHDGRSIRCLRCGRTSHNPTDVLRHFCSNCGVFHDDLMEHARYAWVHKAVITGERDEELTNYLIGVTWAVLDEGFSKAEVRSAMDNVLDSWRPKPKEVTNGDQQDPVLHG